MSGDQFEISRQRLQHCLRRWPRPRTGEGYESIYNVLSPWKVELACADEETYAEFERALSQRLDAYALDQRAHRRARLGTLAAFVAHWTATREVVEYVYPDDGNYEPDDLLYRPVVDLSTTDAASRCGISATAFRQWATKLGIEPSSTYPNKHRSSRPGLLWSLADIERVIEARG